MPSYQLSHYSPHFQALEIFGQHSGVQRDDGDLKVIIDHLAKGVTPTSTHPRLKKSFLEDGILCRKISLKGVEHTQIAIPLNFLLAACQAIHG